MHPIPEETLAGYRNGRLEPSRAAEVSAHLVECTVCAVRAREFSAWGRALAWAVDEGVGKAASPASEARMRRALPRRSPWVWKAAAAALLAAGGWLWVSTERPGSSSPGNGRGTSSPSLRLVSSTEAEILLSSDARLEPEKDAWRLRSGACLASGKARIRIGEAGILVEGEAVVRILPDAKAAGLLREARADASPGFEVAVLSGEARLGALRLGAGEALRDRVKRSLAAAERETLKQAVLGGCAPETRRLQGLARWTRVTPGGSYLVSVKVRFPGRRTRPALVFEADGHPSVWMPDLPEDGAWHVLEVRLTDDWVTLTQDGAVIRRVRRSELIANPAAEIPGAGVAIWEGSMDVEALRVIPFR